MHPRPGVPGIIVMHTTARTKQGQSFEDNCRKLRYFAMFEKSSFWSGFSLKFIVEEGGKPQTKLVIIMPIQVIDFSG